MTAFEMVLGIVFFVCLARVLMALVNRKATQADPQLEQRLRRVEGLEERVRVLEQIVTDRRYDLRAQIDDLERVR